MNSNVFINCPFDADYLVLRNAIIFAVAACGFNPRCTLEDENGGMVRIEKIIHLIAEADLGIHDISRIELDATNGLPRFNMPLELGLFIGAARFGGIPHSHKSLLILDSEPFRYQMFISDIAGQDIRAHGAEPSRLITHVRNWLNCASNTKTVLGGKALYKQFIRFDGDLPSACHRLQLSLDELTFLDLRIMVFAWLFEQRRSRVANP